MDNIEGEHVTENILLGPDGIYRWVYEMSMYKNPTIFITICKVLGLSLGIVYLFVLFLTVPSGGMDDLIGLTGGFMLIMLFLLALGGVAYLIVAASYGGKYVVLFEMNDTGIKHIHIRSQFKKAQKIGLITAFIGGAAGNLTAAGAGLSASARDTSASTFANVKRVKAYRRRNLIKVDQLLNKNQVYAGEADFDFVYGYISSRCVNAKIS
ncbi:MAG: hypothetical protein K6G42_09340 [Lachnospiraceae bacterium]|nr:hypothetical protein [Lachnospiraceae bacterium]